MKKGLLIGGAVAAAAAGAGILYACAESTETQMIRAALAGSASIPQAELELLDRNQNGEVDSMDLYRAKADAVFSRGETLYPVYCTADCAKQLGRTAYHTDTKTLWCSLSGSGIEFDCAGSEVHINLTADSAFSAGDTAAARYEIFRNGEHFTDAQLTEQEQTVIVPNENPEKTMVVRLVKLSESAHSSLGIREIGVFLNKKEYENRVPDVLAPTKQKQHFIEFIGDSITCGYGVDGVYGKDTFKTANENVTKAYAYLTAQKLDADYSMVSYSGHGIISGYTTNGKAVTNQLVPRFYGQVGHCAAVIEGRHKMQDDLWDFSRQPDVIVINLGTNDSSYTGTDPAKQKEFAEAYTAFLKQIREKNPDAAILCTLGIMGQTLCDAVDLAAENYQKETGDTNIKTMRFDMQNDEDGFAVDWHPSAVTHEKAAEKLSEFICAWQNW